MALYHQFIATRFQDKAIYQKVMIKSSYTQHFFSLSLRPQLHKNYFKRFLVWVWLQKNILGFSAPSTSSELTSSIPDINLCHKDQFCLAVCLFSKVKGAQT